jgi:hypothetical protein
MLASDLVVSPHALALETQASTRGEILEEGLEAWCNGILARYGAYGSIHAGLVTYEGELCGEAEDMRIRLKEIELKNMEKGVEKETVIEHRP